MGDRATPDGVDVVEVVIDPGAPCSPSTAVAGWGSLPLPVFGCRR